MKLGLIGINLINGFFLEFLIYIRKNKGILNFLRGRIGIFVGFGEICFLIRSVFF